MTVDPLSHDLSTGILHSHNSLLTNILFLIGHLGLSDCCDGAIIHQEEMLTNYYREAAPGNP